MKKLTTLDTHEFLDRKTLQYLYRKIVKLAILNMEQHKGDYWNGKDIAYREVIGIITDILSS